MDTFKQSKLDNGLTITTEHMPHLESVSIGVYVRTGSRLETAQNAGVAHFLEHMAFKGTQKRTAEEIAREIEDVGGNINAYTSRETTAYHVKLLKENTELGVDILSDILQNPTFLDEELTIEKNVILQELAASLDEPEEIVFDKLQETIYPNSAFGGSILGTKETVSSMTAENLKNFMQNHYHAPNMVISAAGNIEHEKFVNLCHTYFQNLPSNRKSIIETPIYQTGQVHTIKDLEQAHIAMCYKGISNTDKHFYAANIFTSALGGGMTSRLFQELREKRGLAYNIYSYLASYSDCGNFGIYVGTDASKVEESIEVIQKEITSLKQNITDEEMNRAKVGFIAGLKMSLESTDARMGRMAKNQFLYNRHIPIDEVVRDIENTSKADIQAAAEMITNSKTLAISTLGKLKTA